MKSTEEIAARGLKARAEAEKHKIRLLKGVSVTLALCLLLVGGWSLSRQGAVADGGKSGGRTGDNDGSIPAIRQILEAGGISFSGSRITEEEAAAYFEAYGETILQELSAGGVKVKEPHFSETGVSHVRIADGKAVCKTDWRDYLLFDGEDLAAIVTLSREDGPLIYKNWASDPADFPVSSPSWALTLSRLHVTLQHSQSESQQHAGHTEEPASRSTPTSHMISSQAKELHYEYLASDHTCN